MAEEPDRASPIRIEVQAEAGDVFGNLWHSSAVEFIVPDGDPESGVLRAGAKLVKMLENARESILEQIGPDAAAAAEESRKADE